MDISKLLTKYYSGLAWTCGENYESLEWEDTTIPKPTLEELELKYSELLVDTMREQRNQLLRDATILLCPIFHDVNYG